MAYCFKLNCSKSRNTSNHIDKSIFKNTDDDCIINGLDNIHHHYTEMKKAMQKTAEERKAFKKQTEELLKYKVKYAESKVKLETMKLQLEDNKKELADYKSKYEAISDCTAKYKMLLRQYNILVMKNGASSAVGSNRALREVKENSPTKEQRKSCNKPSLKQQKLNFASRPPTPVLVLDETELQPSEFVGNSETDEDDAWYCNQQKQNMNKRKYFEAAKTPVLPTTNISRIVNSPLSLRRKTNTMNQSASPVNARVLDKAVSSPVRKKANTSKEMPEDLNVTPNNANVFDDDDDDEEAFGWDATPDLSQFSKRSGYMPACQRAKTNDVTCTKAVWNAETDDYDPDATPDLSQFERPSNYVPLCQRAKVNDVTAQVIDEENTCDTYATAENVMSEIEIATKDVISENVISNVKVEQPSPPAQDKKKKKPAEREYYSKYGKPASFASKDDSSVIFVANEKDAVINVNESVASDFGIIAMLEEQMINHTINYGASEPPEYQFLRRARDHECVECQFKHDEIEREHGHIEAEKRRTRCDNCFKRVASPTASQMGPVRYGLDTPSEFWRCQFSASGNAAKTEELTS